MLISVYQLIQLYEEGMVDATPELYLVVDFVQVVDHLHRPSVVISQGALFDECGLVHHLEVNHRVGSYLHRIDVLKLLAIVRVFSDYAFHLGIGAPPDALEDLELVHILLVLFGNDLKCVQPYPIYSDFDLIIPVYTLPKIHGLSPSDLRLHLVGHYME